MGDAEKQLHSLWTSALLVLNCQLCFPAALLPILAPKVPISHKTERASGRFWDEQNVVPVTRIEPHFLSFLASTLITVGLREYYTE